MTKKLFVVLVVVSAMLMSLSLVLAAKDAGLRHTPDKLVKSTFTNQQNATLMPKASLPNKSNPSSLFPPLSAASSESAQPNYAPPQNPHQGSGSILPFATQPGLPPSSVKGTVAGKPTTSLGAYPLSTAAVKPAKIEGYQPPHHEIPPSILRQEGGETCASATAISSLPHTATGNTCDNVDDYEEMDGLGCPYSSTSPDVVYSYTPGADEVIDIDMYGSAYDTKIWVYEDNCVTGNLVACNDDYYSDYVSAIFGLSIYVGHTYYIVVDGYGGGCGDYLIDVSVHVDCDVVCPSGGIPEGEPTCADEYVDTYNGGCNSSPYVFQNVNLGDVICGTSGTYLFGGSQYRDTDWFRVVLTDPTTLSWKAVAEFPLLIFIINGGTEDCLDYTVLGSATANPCDTAFLSFDVPAGVYWLWAGPSVFTGYPCGLEYVGIVSGVAATTGACCNDVDPYDCQLLTPTDCAALSGHTFHGLGTNCGPPNPCLPAPPNDECTGAVVVNSFPTTVYGSTNGATIDCPGVLDWEAVWYRVDLPYAVNKLTLDYCPTNAEIYTVGIVLYNTCPPDCYSYVLASSYQFVTCGSGFMDPQMWWSGLLQGSVWIPVYVVDPSGSPFMDFGITFTVEEIAAPPNDNCANATPVGDVTNLDFSTDGATFDGPGLCQTASNVWYLYTATCDGNAYVSVCGSSYDTKIAAYDGSVCDPIGTMLACNDDACGGALQSEISFPVVMGQSYLIEIGGYGTSTGDGIMSINCGLAPDNDECTGAPIINTFPQTVYGTTVGASVDCPGLLDWNAVWYRFDVPYTCNNITVDYCPTDWSIGQIGIVLYNSCPQDCPAYIVTSGYQFVACSNGTTNPQMWWYNLPGPASYWLPVYPFAAASFGFTVSVDECVACDVVCPTEGIPEGEPTCYDDYTDTYNGGCNSSPYVFQNVNPGDVICGTSGTYLFGGSQYRDTDWYRVVLTSPSTLSWKVVAEFPLLIFMMNGGTENCSDYTVLGNTTANPCDTAFLSFDVPAGVYWLWAGPSVFTGYPCGLEYVGIVGGVGATGCCQLTGSCAEMTEADCITAGGTFFADPYTCVGTTCEPPAPDTFCHLQWDNGSAAWYASNYTTGDQQGNYFDPETMCSACPNVYPFLLSQVSAVLYDFGAAGTHDVNVHIYAVDPDNCAGPGVELYSFGPVTLTTFYPDEAFIPLPEVLCLNEDFIVAFEYLDAGVCALWTNEAIANCISWLWCNAVSPGWLPMESVWSGVGYHMIRADGICNSGACNAGDECNLQNDNGAIASYFGSFAASDRIAEHFDPEEFCDAPVYPYNISDVELPLYDFGGAGTVDIKVGVYLQCQVPCNGPGTKIYESPVFTVTTFYPNMAHLVLPGAICVYEPFFLAIEYENGVTGSTPSVLFDDGTPPIDTCIAWMWFESQGYSPPWYEWYDFWSAPVPGRPIIRVSGYTNSPLCAPPPCDTTIETIFGGSTAAYYWKQPPNDEFMNMKFEMPSDHGGRLEGFEVGFYAAGTFGTPDPDFYVWLSDGTYPLDNNPPYQAIANFHLDYSELAWYPSYTYVSTYSHVLEFEPGEMFHVGFNHAYDPNDTLSVLSNNGGDPNVENNSGGWYQGAWESYYPYAFLINAFICPYAPENPTFTMQCKPALGFGTPGDPATNVFTVGLIPVIGYNLPVTMSLLSVAPPENITATFNPNPATPPDTADVAITVGAGVAYGDYVLTFQGVGSDAQTKVCNVTLTVQPPYDEAVVNFFHGYQRTSTFGAVGNDAKSNFMWYGTNYLFDGSFMSATTGPDHMAMDIYNCIHTGFIPSGHVVVTHQPWCSPPYEENYGEVAYSNFYTEESTISCEYDSLFVIGLSDVASTDFSIKIKIYYNPTTTPIPELHIGLFEDWDVGDAYNNWADMDTLHNIIWQYDPIDPSIVFGMFKAPFYDEQMWNMAAVRNPVYVWPGAGFCDPDFPEMLDSLYLLMTRPGYTYATEPDTDYSLLMCPPPFSLNPGEKHIEVWFDFGRNLNDGMTWEQWYHKLLRYAGFYRGDVNASDTLELPSLDVSDLVYLINYLYQGGQWPQPFIDQGNVDGNGPYGGPLDIVCPKNNVDVQDLVYLLNYVFKGGPAPVDYVRFIPQKWSRPSLFLSPNW